MSAASTPSASKKQKRSWQDYNAEKRKKSKERLIKQIIPDDVDETPSKQSSARKYTVSLALAGSILDNAQTAELKTYLAGQIARAIAVFNIDEVVVFNDQNDQDIDISDEAFYGVTEGNCCVQLARILKFLECPQYLRKSFFPMHPDLKFAGILNPLDAPHHLRRDMDSIYREGVVTKKGEGCSFVNIGLFSDAKVNSEAEEGQRVTVKLKNNKKGTIVPPETPKNETGVYWGYDVRLAKNLQTVFTQSPYEKGYDVTIGTSERGTNVDSLSLKQFKHLLIVFGGVQGIEAAVKADPALHNAEAESLFDYYINTCPNQGSRTIRTEEAILVSLSILRPKILSRGTK